MEWNFEGKVRNERTSDTGDPSFDYDYTVDGRSVPSMESILSRYEGDKVKVSIVVERIYDSSDEDDY